MSNKHFTTNVRRAERIAQERQVREARQTAAAHRRDLLALQRKFNMRAGREMV